MPTSTVDSKPPATGSLVSELTSNVPKNALYNLFGQSALLLLGFLAARILYRGLGEDAFGLILFATTLNAVLATLLDLGMTATTIRVVAVHRRDPGYVTAYIKTATTLYWLVYLFLVGAAYLIVPIIVVHWLHLSTLSPVTAKSVLWLLLAGCLSSVPRNLYSGVFRGLQRMEFNNVIEVGMTVLQQGGAVIILVEGGDLLTVVLWMLLTFALSVATYVVLLTRFLPLEALVPGYSRAVIQDEWKYAASVAGSSVLSMVFAQSDKVVVSKLVALSMFGYYTFVWTSAWKVAALASVVSQAAFPSLAALLQDGAEGQMVKQYRKLQNVVCYATAVAIGALTFAALPAFGYLFGPRVAENLLLPTLLLSFAYYMHATLIMLMTVAVAARRPDLVTRLNLIGVVTFLPALVGLVALLGLTGAGLAWLGYYALAYGYLVPRVCQSCLKVTALSWYRDIGQVFAFVAVTYGVAWSLCFSFHRSDPLAWALSFLAATGAFAALVGVAVGGRTLRNGLGRLYRAGQRDDG